MERITHAEIARMRANGYDRSTIAEAEELLGKCHRADELIESIQRVFFDVELGAGIGLRESRGIDDYADPEELRRLRAADEKHDWQKIPAEVLNDCHAAPSFLDAKGMRFHSPAFLVAELSGKLQHDFIERLVDRSYSAKDFPHLLNDLQRDAIVACIRFYITIQKDGLDLERIDAAIAAFQGSRENAGREER